MSVLRRLPIPDIKLDRQPAEYLDPEKVKRYARMLRSGVALPPVWVYSDGSSFWLYDGFHRIAAASRIKRKTFWAEVIPGTYADLLVAAQREADSFNALIASFPSRKSLASPRAPDPDGSRVKRQRFARRRGRT
jgi:ParB-like chromosome segregation protein Spo0J